MRGGSDRREAGFTLIEMLVSLALLAMAATLMLEGFASGQKLWAGSAARTARGESIEAAQAILRARIEALRPVTRFGTDLAFADVDGADNRLIFISPPAEADQPAAARRFRLALDGRGDLVLGWAAPQVDAEADAVYTDQILLDDVGGLDISYYGPGPGGGPAQWWSRWSRRASPPQLVRIKLRLKDGDARFWPELVVHPAAVVDTQCSVDPATGACRGRT